MSGPIRNSLLLVWVAGFLIGCSDDIGNQLHPQASIYVEPDWQKFRSIPFEQNVPDAPADYAQQMENSYSPTSNTKATKVSLGVCWGHLPPG